MHRTLKAETTRPQEPTMEPQQKRFDEFRRVYNEERPHEALGQKRPARSGYLGLVPLRIAEALVRRRLISHGINHQFTRHIPHNGMQRLLT